MVPLEDVKRRDFICDFIGLGSDPGYCRCLLINYNKGYMFPEAAPYRFDDYPNYVPLSLKKLLRRSRINFRHRISYDRPVKSLWPVSPNEIDNPCPCPIARKFKDMEPEYPDDIKQLVLESKNSNHIEIEIGQSLDVTSLLMEMNYLDRINGERVDVKKMKSFSGKYKMVCCFYVPILREHTDDSHYLL